MKIQKLVYHANIATYQKQSHPLEKLNSLNFRITIGHLQSKSPRTKYYVEQDA
jgi:hypothetical protein